MEDLSRFCCQNEACLDYGKRGGGNLRVCFRYGPARFARSRTRGRSTVTLPA